MKQATATSPAQPQRETTNPNQRETTVPNQRVTTVSGAGEKAKSSPPEDVSRQKVRPAPTPGGNQTSADREQIRQRAYELYLERGRQDGSAEEDWFQAELEILGGTRSQKKS